VRKCFARVASAAMVDAYCTRADSSGSLGIIDSEGSTYLRTHSSLRSDCLDRECAQLWTGS
jgi:hypothetical protein